MPRKSYSSRKPPTGTTKYQRDLIEHLQPQFPLILSASKYINALGGKRGQQSELRRVVTEVIRQGQLSADLNAPRVVRHLIMGLPEAGVDTPDLLTPHLMLGLLRTGARRDKAARELKAKQIAEKAAAFASPPNTD